MKKLSRPFLLLALITLSVLSGGCNTAKERNVKELRKGAVNGSSIAQMALAMAYTVGQNGVEINPSAAVFWLRKVAVKGQADAQFMVGMAYYRGEGVSKDEGEGLFWINQAAQQNHSEAKEFLRKTPHNKIIEASSNPKNWGYVFSSALFGDLWDAYPWLFVIGVVIALAAAPIGVPAFVIFILYFIS